MIAGGDEDEDEYVRLPGAPEEHEEEDAFIAEGDSGMIFVDDSDEESPPDGDDGGGGADDAMDMAADDVEGAEPMVGMEAAAATEPDTAVFTFSAHEGPVYCIASSPSPAGAAGSSTVATGGGDDAAYLWSADPAGTPQKLDGHTDSIVYVGFSNDGQYLATGGLDGVVKIWQVGTAAHVADLEGSTEGIEWGCWHPRGPVFLAGCSDGSVWMWNAPKATCMMVFSGHSDAACCGGFTPDGKRVFTGSADCSVKVWNPKTGVATTTFAAKQCHCAPVTAMAASTDSPMLISGDANGQLLLLQRQTGKVIGKLEHHTDSIEAVAFAPGQPLAVSASMDGHAIVWDLNTSTARLKFAHEDAGVVQLVWPTLQQSLIATGATDGVVRIWDCRSGAQVARHTGHRDCCLCMTASSDGHYITCGSDDTTAKMFQMPTM